METYLVKDVMSCPVTSITPNTRLPAIKLLLRNHNIRHLPVVDHGELIGIISLGDVRNAFPSDTALLSTQDMGPDLDKVTAAHILRPGVITVAAEAPLAEAVDLLLQYRVGCLPVMKGDRMVGIMTAGDILRTLFPRKDALPADLALRHTFVKQA
jgi:CBS domain-containing protein